MLKRLAALGLGAMTFLSASGTGFAGGRADGGADPVAGVISAEIQVSSGAYRGAPSGCRYHLWTDVLLRLGPSNRPVLVMLNGVRHAKYLKTCPNSRPNPEAPFLLGTAVLVPWIPPRTGTPTWLVDAAFNAVAKSVPKPSFESAPPDQVTYVNLGMWFWTSTSWVPVVATAQVPTSQGWRWATVTARPIGLTFHPGDGDLGTGDVECGGQGRVWEARFGDDTPTECMYTYVHSSVMADNQRAFPASVSIRWDVTFTSWIDANPRPRGELLTTSRIPGGIEVKEIQAIVTG